jgi:hypothetical protein
LFCIRECKAVHGFVPFERYRLCLCVVDAERPERRLQGVDTTFPYIDTRLVVIRIPLL